MSKGRGLRGGGGGPRGGVQGEGVPKRGGSGEGVSGAEV